MKVKISAPDAAGDTAQLGSSRQPTAGGSHKMMGQFKGKRWLPALYK